MSSTGIEGDEKANVLVCYNITDRDCSFIDLKQKNLTSNE